MNNPLSADTLNLRIIFIDIRVNYSLWGCTETSRHRLNTVVCNAEHPFQRKESRVEQISTIQTLQTHSVW